MTNEHKIVQPIYHQIALDIANKIVNGKYKKGDRFKGRSTLSTQYKVSPETIRRSMCLLQDMDIVTVHANVGIEVISEEKAIEFVEKFRDIKTLTSIKNTILELVNGINQQNAALVDNVKEFMDNTEKYRILNPFMPFELEITSKVWFIGKSISDMNFWHNTGATIIAIKRGDETILSPGPYVDFKKHDVIVIVGDEEALSRTKKFLYTEKA